MTTMAGIQSEPRGESLADVTARITGLLADHRSIAAWWVDLVGQLDQLGVRLMSRHGELASRSPFVRQITTDAPHMASRLNRLAAEQEKLESDLLVVRMLAGEAAGNPEAGTRVRTAVHDYLHRLSRHEQKSNDALFDAYERDIGGE